MRSNNPTPDQRRMFILLLGFTICMAVLILRLVWIQLVATSAWFDRKTVLVSHAVQQRVRSIEIEEGRGDLYDRHMQPLTGTRVRSLVVFPLQRDQVPDEDWSRLADALQVDPHRLRSYVDGLKEPALWTGGGEETFPVTINREQEQWIRDLHIPGIAVIDYKLRYTEESLAQHLIGFIAQHPERLKREYTASWQRGRLPLITPIGASGLELAFDSYLHGIGGKRLALFMDGEGRYLPGLGMRILGPSNEYYPVKLVTTIDAAMQRQVERILDQYGIAQGAVVVLDARNADVRVMASRPQFDPYQVDPLVPDWNNRALKALIPGSIFKTVVAAAALEAGVVREDEVFHCEGALGKYGFTCWKHEGHGALTFRQAYAQSCNITFAKVMERLDATQLTHVARQLGLTRRIGWQGRSLGYPELRQFEEEDAGQLFAPGTPVQDGGVLAQTAIGQRDVRMSVLQAANLMVSLLNHGEVKSPRVVKELRYHNDRMMRSFPVQTLVPKYEGISHATAERLLHWMEDTVQLGTAQALRSATWALAGKTGTAQVPAPGQDMIIQWFAGYGPVDAPRYAIAVAVEMAPDHQSHMAVRLVKEIMDIFSNGS